MQRKLENSMSADQGNLLLRSIEEAELVLEFAQLAPHFIHRVPAYFFRMLLGLGRSEVGNINLRVGSTLHIELYAGRVGFAVHPAYRGNRYASRSLRLLTPLARELGSIRLGSPATGEPSITPESRTRGCKIR